MPKQLKHVRVNISSTVFTGHFVKYQKSTTNLNNYKMQYVSLVCSAFFGGFISGHGDVCRRKVLTRNRILEVYFQA
jgi:hypothetical protein